MEKYFLIEIVSYQAGYFTVNVIGSDTDLFQLEELCDHLNDHAKTGHSYQVVDESEYQELINESYDSMHSDDEDDETDEVNELHQLIEITIHNDGISEIHSVRTAENWAALRDDCIKLNAKASPSMIYAVGPDKLYEAYLNYENKTMNNIYIVLTKEFTTFGKLYYEFHSICHHTDAMELADQLQLAGKKTIVLNLGL